MNKGGRPARARRAMWTGATLLLVAVVLVLVALFPHGLRGPETIARNYVSALMKTPQDPNQLREAARIGGSDDPETLIDGLSTRIALDFLRARSGLGAQQDVSVTDTRSAGPKRYIVVMRVTESATDGSSLTRRFQVGLLKADNGDWRVAAITVIE